MAANLSLAEEKGLSEEDIAEINVLHESLDEMVDKYIELGYAEEREEEIHKLEFMLQKLWKLPQDKNYHTRARRFKFACKWYGRKFLDKDTGTKFTFGKNAVPGEFIPIGNSALDVGDGYYSRMIGNIAEICPQCERDLGAECKMSCDEEGNKRRKE